jgi:hypothetical protein
MKVTCFAFCFCLGFFSLPAGATDNPAAAQAIVGHTFYACRGTLGFQRTDGRALGEYDFFPTTPLVVSAVSVEKQADMSRYLLAVTVKAAAGPEMRIPAIVSFGDLSEDRILQATADGAHLRLQPPNGGSPTIARGTTEDDAECILGIPDSINTYNEAKQLIYNDGRLIIDLDESGGRVQSVTEFGR